MVISISILSGIFAIFIIWQLMVWIGEIRQKNRQCRAAIKYCSKCHSLLLVVGGPWGGHSWRRRLNMPAHISGDVNVDLRVTAISGYPNSVVANVTNLPFPNKTFGAAFASHLLEHLPNSEQAGAALAEMERVSEVVYIAYPSRQSIVARLIPDHHVWIWQKDNTVYLQSRKSGKQKSKVDNFKVKT